MKKLRNLDLSFSLSLGQIITILIGIVWGIIYVVGVLEYGFFGELAKNETLLSLITFITGVLLIILTVTIIIKYIIDNWNKNIINFTIKNKKEE